MSATTKAPSDRCLHSRSLYNEDCLACDAIWHRQVIVDLKQKLAEHQAALATIKIALAATIGTRVEGSAKP